MFLFQVIGCRRDREYRFKQNQEFSKFVAQFSQTRLAKNVSWMNRNDWDHFCRHNSFKSSFPASTVRLTERTWWAEANTAAEMGVRVRWIITCCKCRETSTHFSIVGIFRDWCLIESRVSASAGGWVGLFVLSVPCEANQSGGVRVRAIRQGPSRSFPLAHLHVKSPFHPSTLPNCC